MGGQLDTYVSGDRFGFDYLFVHVATLRMSEQRRCSSYRNEIGVCDKREKRLMSRGWPLQSIGMFLTVGSVSVAVAE